MSENVGSYVVGNTYSAYKDGYRGLDADLGCCKESEKRLRAAEGVREAVLSLLLVMLLKSKWRSAQLAWKAVLNLPLLWLGWLTQP